MSLFVVVGGGLIIRSLNFVFFLLTGKSTFMENLLKHRFALIKNCPPKAYLFYNQYVQKKYEGFILSGQLVAYEVGKLL